MFERREVVGPKLLWAVHLRGPRLSDAGKVLGPDVYAPRIFAAPMYRGQNCFVN